MLLFGEVILGMLTSLCATFGGPDTDAAETPRAKKRRAAGNLIGDIIIVDGSKQAAKRNVEMCESVREMDDEVRRTDEEMVGGSSSLKYEKEGMGGSATSSV